MLTTLFSKTYHRRLLENLLQQHAAKLTGNILDIGSKNQRYSHLFKGTVTAVDKQPNPAQNVDNGDLDKTLPYGDASFDSVVCLEVLEYVHNLDHAVAEIQRVLIPEGLALISIPFLYHDHDDQARYTRSKLQESFKKFSSVTCLQFGNGWTVIYDILLKKTTSHSNRLIRLPGLLFLSAYYFLIKMLKLEQQSDRYYSGVFIIARR